jgi:hypothetical protein
MASSRGDDRSIAAARTALGRPPRRARCSGPEPAARSELLFPLMLINSEENMTFAVGLLTFVSKFSVDWGQMMAAGVLALLPACIFFVFIQRYLVQGLTAGALKG